MKCKHTKLWQGRRETANLREGELDRARFVVGGVMWHSDAGKTLYDARLGAPGNSTCHILLDNGVMPPAG